MKIVLQNADITKAKSHRKKAPLELKEGRCQFLFVLNLLVFCSMFSSFYLNVGLQRQSQGNHRMELASFP